MDFFLILLILGIVKIWLKVILSTMHPILAITSRPFLPVGFRDLANSIKNLSRYLIKVRIYDKVLADIVAQVYARIK